MNDGQVQTEVQHLNGPASHGVGGGRDSDFTCSPSVLGRNLRLRSRELTCPSQTTC